MILFQIIYHFAGLKPAILGSLLFAIVEFIVLKIQRRFISPFFIFSFCLVMIFGVLDLIYTSSFFLRFESTILNLVMAGYFGLSLFKEKSLVENVAEHQGRISSEIYPDKTFFFRFMTSVWAIYFAFKAGVFLWISFNVDLEMSFMLRMIFGAGTFYALLGVSLFLNRQIWDLLLRLKLMPSTRE